LTLILNRPAASGRSFNISFRHDAQIMAEHFLRIFERSDNAIALSCSCAATIRNFCTGLFSDPKNIYLTSLLPAIHVVVLSTHQLVSNRPEVFYLLQQSTPISHSATLITGPSRSGDIKIALGLGVHGPKEVHAILLD